MKLQQKSRPKLRSTLRTKLQHLAAATALLSSTVLCAFSAHAAVSFDNVPASFGTYQEAGYTFSVFINYQPGSASFGDGTFAPGTLDWHENALAIPNSTGLGPFVIKVTKDDGGNFDLRSFDSFISGDDTLRVFTDNSNFTFANALYTSTLQPISATHTASLVWGSLSDFTNLKSLYFQANLNSTIPNLFNGVSIDNLDLVATGAGSPGGNNVPEPASLALAALGLLGTAATRRRKAPML